MSEGILRPLQVPERPIRLREAAYESIKNAILEGRMGATQPLFEDSIAALLGISRTPVREALALLEHEGLIAPRAGRGLWVAVLSKAEFLDLRDANEVVEPYLARVAAARATAAHIEAMSRGVQDKERAANRGELTSFLAQGRRLHRLIGEAAGNPVLTRFVVGNEERADMYLLASVESFDFDAWWPSVHEHRAILEAIVRREPEEAARLITYHSQSVRQRLQRVFTEGEQEEVKS